jgi:hypothetical protein
MDEADQAQMAEESYQAVMKKYKKQVKLDPGKPGECEYCGEWSQRLIKSVCAPCRDKYHLP